LPNVLRNSTASRRFSPSSRQIVQNHSPHHRDSVAKRKTFNDAAQVFVASGQATSVCSRMRIAVLADTHDRYPDFLPQRLASADEIWHLGDVCAPETLVEFEQLGPPLHVVLGNNDASPQWPLILRLERDGVRFHLEHIPPARPPRDCDVVLHGHTHVPRDEHLAGVRWLNPGCITRPNRGAGPSYAWLTIARGAITWELVRLPAAHRRSL
jgi:uncharacterized protein